MHARALTHTCVCVCVYVCVFLRPNQRMFFTVLTMHTFSFQIEVQNKVTVHATIFVQHLKDEKPVLLLAKQVY